LAGTVEGTQVKTWMSERVVTVERVGNQVIRGSWRTAVWALWMFAGLQAEVFGRRVDPVEEQTEAVQKTEGSVEVLGRTPTCSSAVHLVVAR
jgi:hypothetical protein